MVNTNANIANRPASQDILNTAKVAATQLTVKVATPNRPQTPQVVQPVKDPSSVVSLSQSSSKLDLYSANGTLDSHATQNQTDGFGNSDGSYTAGQTSVKVTIEKSDSGFDNKLYYSTDNFATKHYVGIDNQTGTVDIGTFQTGTKIDFGIDNGQGDFFRTGSAADNPDKVKHTNASAASDGAHRIGFEDLKNGGDRDFNDAILTVRSAPSQAKTSSAKTSITSIKTAELTKQDSGQSSSSTSESKKSTATNQGPPTPVANTKEPPTAPAPVADIPPPIKIKLPLDLPVAAKEPKDKTNSSGLGDNTNPNPGQGADKVNPPNTGTLNPSAPKALAAATPIKKADPLSSAKHAETEKGDTTQSASSKPDPENLAIEKSRSTAPIPAVPIPVPPPLSSAKPAEVLKKIFIQSTSSISASEKLAAEKQASSAPITNTKNPASIPTATTNTKLSAQITSPVTEPVVAKLAEDKTNRSGLGDNTNPGQGAGKINSPNLGTQNPSSISLATADKKLSDAEKETGPSIDKKAVAALQAYQPPKTQKFTTNVQV